MSNSHDRLCCSLCLIDGIWSAAIKGWVGIPICREHLAQTIVRTTVPTMNPLNSPNAHHPSLNGNTTSVAPTAPAV